MKNSARHFVKFSLVCFLFALLSLNSYAQTTPTATPTNRLTIEHLFQLGEVSDPQINPEGDWIAYTVKRDDLEADSWIVSPRPP